MPHYYTYDSNLRDRNKFTSTVETSFGTKRYFSSLDTEVYFGQTQIDEMVAIDFTIAEPKLPIYGFNSFYPNRMVSGRRTVQGTFAINFTHTMYLLNILSSVDDSILANDYEALVYRCPEEDSTGLGIGNSAIFNKRFDITVSYGYGKTEGKQTYNSCYQTIVGVQIVDYRQALDTEGNPILDMYSFIAKDIRYEAPVSTETEDTTDQGQTPELGVTGGATGGSPEEETQTSSIRLAEPPIANKFIDGEFKSLTTQCADTNVVGFAIAPLFYENNGSYYVSLSIEGINSTAEIYKNIKVTITDRAIKNQTTDINFSLNFKDLKDGMTTPVMISDSLRQSAVEMMKRYNEEKGHAASFAISFTADVDGQEKTIEHVTYLIQK